MQQRTYETRKGKVIAKSITEGQLQNLRNGLPLGIVPLKRDGFEDTYGIVTRCGEEDAWCLKQQSVEVDPKDEQTVLLAYTLLMANSIKGYVGYGFGGCLLPSLYRRRKPNGVEVGFAYFGSPCPSGIEATEFPPASYDRRFGIGFLTMFRHFYQELKKSSQRLNISLAPVIGLDIRTSSHIEGIVLHCIVHGSSVFLCSPGLDENDYFLTFLASSGMKDVVHLPSQPIQILEKHRQLAKMGETPEEGEIDPERLSELKKKVQLKLRKIRQAKGKDCERDDAQ